MPVCACVRVVGEMLSLLVTRTAPGLGNATVDWAIQGPRVARTFTHTSGLLFFTEVNKLTRVTPQETSLTGVCLMVYMPRLVFGSFWCIWYLLFERLLSFTQGTLNATIVLQLLEDATPEENEEYRVVLSNIHTYGKSHSLALADKHN